MKEDFMYTLCDDSNALCIQGIQNFIQRDKVNNAVKILDFMVKRAGVKIRQHMVEIETNDIGLMRNAVKINKCCVGP
jgi:hypothetical protein